ncbi:MAG: hypothetical protein K8T91_19845 [Planctomycetes bacterium]|nr:hypothetical protein [Planctomycetota bacterium]
MSDIIVTDEQAQILSQSAGVVLLRTANGKVLARVEPLDLEEPFTSSFTDEEIAEAERRAESSKTWHTTVEIIGRMQDANQQWPDSQ